MLSESCFFFLSALCVSQVKGGIEKQLNQEVLHYDYRASFFDIFVSCDRTSPDHIPGTRSSFLFSSPVLPVTHCSPLNLSSLPLLPLLCQLLAVFRFATLILAYAVCKLRHWWAIAVSPIRYSSLFVSAEGESAAGKERLQIRLVDAVVSICNICTVNIKDIDTIKITLSSSPKQEARQRIYKTKIGGFTVCISLHSDIYTEWLTDTYNNLYYLHDI